MLNRAVVLSGVKVVLIILMIHGMQVDMAPAERDPPPSLTHAPAIPPKSSTLNLKENVKHWPLSSKTSGLDRTTRSTDKTPAGNVSAGVRAGRSRISTSGPDKRAKMLKMISALEGLHRTFSSTLSSQITIMSRANGRNPGRKSKVLPAAVGEVKPTTATLSAVDSTASRASADIIGPKQNNRKSLASQNKKTNKRVCFWKYCSQN